MAVEVDETRLHNLTTIAQIADGLMKTPAARRKYLEAVKQVYPNVSIPEIDAARPVLEDVEKVKTAVFDEIKKLREDLQKDQEGRQVSAVKLKYEQGRQSLIDLGYTPEGVADVEKFMTDNGIMDWNIARKSIEYDNPRPAPARPSRGNMFDVIESKTTGDDYIKKLFETGGKDESVLDDQINKVLAESRQGLGAARAFGR